MRGTSSAHSKKFFGKNGYSVRCLNKGDLPQITEMNAHVMNHIRNRAMYQTPYDTDLLCLCLCYGLAVGVFSGNQLAGYRLAYYPDSRCENLGGDIGLSAAQSENTAQCFGIAVHPAHAGKGIGSKMASYFLCLLSMSGFSHAAATCHPGNLNSLMILFKSGFRIKALKKKYGGKQRYVLHKTFGGRDCGTAEETLVDHRDIVTQKQMLARGYVGLKARKTESGHGIVFAR